MGVPTGLKAQWTERSISTPLEKDNPFLAVAKDPTALAVVDIFQLRCENGRMALRARARELMHARAARRPPES